MENSHMKLALSATIAEIDAFCEKSLGLPVVDLMKKSGEAVAYAVRKRTPKGVLFALECHPFCEPCAQSVPGSNLKAKRKRLGIVFATLFAAKQGVC